jgi:hypothetical protein
MSSPHLTWEEYREARVYWDNNPEAQAWVHQKAKEAASATSLQRWFTENLWTPGEGLSPLMREAAERFSGHWVIAEFIGPVATCLIMPPGGSQI